MLSEIKGTSIRNYPLVLSELRGHEVAARVMSALSAEIREHILGGKLVASGWYPLAWKTAMHEAARRVTGEIDLSRIMGFEQTRRDIRGTYRVFARMASPRYILLFTSRMFSNYLRPGSMRVVEARHGFARVVFENCHGFSHHTWQDVLGSAQAALHVSGAIDTRARLISGCRDGDASGEALAFWSMDPSVNLDAEGDDDPSESAPPSGVRPSGAAPEKQASIAPRVRSR